MAKKQDEFEIPTLEGLDSKQADYLKILEEGFLKIKGLVRAQTPVVDELEHHTWDEMNRILGGIEGVTRQELPTKTVERKVGERVVRKETLGQIIYGLPSGEVPPEVEDKLTA